MSTRARPARVSASATCATLLSHCRTALRRGVFALLASGASLLALPGTATAAGGCSPYFGQVLINELRIGASNKSNKKNQVELFNIGSVPSAVWRSWRLEVYSGTSLATATQKTSIALAGSGFTSSGPYIWNSTAKIFLKNKEGAWTDVAIYDVNGDHVAYVAIEGRLRPPPICLGATTTLLATTNKDTNGSIRRPTDGGAWPTTIVKTSVHTIGRRNDCTAGGGDLVIGISTEILTPVVNLTPAVYSVTIINNACSTRVKDVFVKVDNITTASYASISHSVTKGSRSLLSGTQTWDIGDLDAGVTATLTITGTPKSVGLLTHTAWVSGASTALLNLADDTDTETIDVQAFTWVGFDVTSYSLTEGRDTSYRASISAVVVPQAAITVNYTVSGTAGVGDTNLPASGTLTINPADLVNPDGVDIVFAILNDALYEPTKTIILTITSVSSADSTVRVSVASPVMTITLYDDDAVNYYEISQSSSGLSCLPTTVTVVACADASSPCTNKTTGVAGLTATLIESAGSLASSTITFDATGVATTTLSHPGAGNGESVSVTLSGEQAPAVNPRRCCPNGIACAAANSCSTAFASAGFIIAGVVNGSAATLPTQTAASASSGYWLRAVRTSTTTKACEAVLSGATTVDVSYTCANPGSCSAGNRMTITGSSATAIAGNPAGGGAGSTAVPMVFDANGNAPFSFAYADVGLVSLAVRKTVGGALLAGSSNAFVVRPAGFSLSTIRCTSYAAGSCATGAIASPGNNPGASTPAGMAFMPAGKPFSVTVTAVDALGNATPNYGRETVPEGVVLSAALLAPAGGNAPALGNPSGFGSFSGGAATGTGFSWAEVGAISLTPRVADSDYLGAGNVTGSPSGAVGRFIPNHFTVAVSPACSASFTYSGQPFSATVTARSAAGSTTLNYSGGGSAKALALSDAAALASGSFSAGASLAAAAFSSGVATATPTYGFSAKLSAPRSLPLRATDTDGSSSAGFSEGSTPLHSGRLRVANGHGRENAALQLALRAEYWSGASWVTSSADSCTAVPAAAVALGGYRNHLGNATAAWSTSATAVTLAAGTGVLILAAPTPTATGSVELALNLGSTTADQSCTSGLPATTGANRPWLRAQNGACAASFDRDPSARASFGIFAPESRRTVHAREIF